MRQPVDCRARLIARLPRYSHISSYIKEHLHWLPISTRMEYKVLLIVLKAQMGQHLNISVTPSDFRPLPHPFVLYTPLTGGRTLSLELVQLWLNLDLFSCWPFPLESPSTISSCFFLVIHFFFWNLFSAASLVIRHLSCGIARKIVLMLKKDNSD